jgi:hypothetical protein
MFENRKEGRICRRVEQSGYFVHTTPGSKLTGNAGGLAAGIATCRLRIGAVGILRVDSCTAAGTSDWHSREPGEISAKGINQYLVSYPRRLTNPAILKLSTFIVPRCRANFCWSKNTRANVATAGA